jgi:M6 family metalloprotease-like protein
MTGKAKDRAGLRRAGLVVLAVVATFTAKEVAAQSGDGTFLGLKAGPGDAPNFWEGPTNYQVFPRPKGVVTAVMLFARFPDAETEESTHDVFKRLVPDAIAFFNRASYGQLTLTVDVRHRWVPMDEASTSPRYDGSKWETHKTYVAEVVRKTARDVNFSKYEIVYIVGSKNKGMPTSPTWLARDGMGIRSGAAEVRHAVTFGNDIRGPNWGWQALAHETGHVFGLPDLYSYKPGTGRYKDNQKYVGFWDLMGWPGAGSEYLAWHKYKLGWLTDENVLITKKTSRTALVTPIDKKGDVKAVAVPIDDVEAYVVEVRGRDRQVGSETGVLCYKVSLVLGNGQGPIQVIPAKPDDGKRELEKKFITLYNALYFKGTIVDDADRRVKIEILGREGRAYRIRVTR